MNYLQRHKGIILGLVTLLLLFFAGLTSREGSRMAQVGEVLSVPFAPLRQAVRNIAGSLEQRISYFRDLKSLTEENRALKETLAQQVTDQVELESLRKENQELRDALSFDRKYQDYRIIVSRIISRDLDNWGDALVLDAGRQQGVNLAMKEQYPGSCAVVSGSGLVGRVIQTTYNTSRVLSIIDHGSTVSGVLTRSRRHVEVKGLQELKMKGLCFVGNIDYDTDISLGDYVETSGIGNNYPRSLIIGQIVQVNRDERTRTISAVLKPMVDFQSLNTVVVLQGKEEMP
ncbi:MAG TPA: rod shape-determining protein MreC [Clostridiales bacterium]|nr:rod shape-determining protein MreC [Clostridiales bacterium]